MPTAPDATDVAPDRAIALLPPSVLRDDELVILLVRPSVLYIVLSCVSSLMMLLILMLALALLAIKVSWIPWDDEHAYALGGVLIMLRLGWQVVEWFSRIYVLTDRRVIAVGGVLRAWVFETSLRNIQQTLVTMTVRERLFALGTLRFATAGTDTYDAAWVMIRRPIAVQRRVQETIARYRGG